MYIYTGYPHTLYIKGPPPNTDIPAPSYPIWNIVSDHVYSTLVLCGIASTFHFGVLQCVYMGCWSWIAN